MLGGLAEAEARVDDDRVSRDAGRDAPARAPPAGRRRPRPRGPCSAARRGCASGRWARRRSAASRASASSAPTPQTSLIRSAPASRAASATAGLVVSTLIGDVRQGRADGRDDRHDAVAAPRPPSPAHGPAGSTRHRRRGGRRPRRPSGAAWRRAAGDSGPARGSPAREQPVARERVGVTLRMPITNVRAPQANAIGRGADRPACGGGWRSWAVIGTAAGRAGPDRRRGAPGPPRQGRASPRRRSARRRAASAASSGGHGSGRVDGTVRRAAAARQRAASSAGGHGARQVHAGRDDPRVRGAPPARAARRRRRRRPCRPSTRSRA